MARPPLPLTVIGGFLGAGKTTLLNRWLREAGGRRLAVLVNDFGAINLDAERIASSAGDVIALTNGCVCCQIGDDLGAAWTLKLDGEIGSIECGKRADFCVLEDDPLEMDPMALKDARVWGTVLSGRVFKAQYA